LSEKRGGMVRGCNKTRRWVGGGVRGWKGGELRGRGSRGKGRSGVMKGLRVDGKEGREGVKGRVGETVNR